ncbi:hypothetical protein GALL_403830 [mine drainage metagenome]|uniref:Uncharacterized protein n=1 Tax=mine drainage metagenome TaxID=410659 RepID=A0A1J5Q2H4_9ZZZZ
MVQPVAEPHGVDDRVELRAVDRAPGDVERQGDVLGRRQGRDEVERLEDEAEPRAAQPGELALVHPTDVLAVDDDAPRRRGVETGHAVHEGGLARSGGSHDRRELPAREVDVDPGERVHRGVSGPVGLDEAAGGCDRTAGEARSDLGCRGGVVRRTDGHGALLG